MKPNLPCWFGIHLCALACVPSGWAQAPNTAFQNVSLIRMEQEVVEPGMTVIIRDGRIANIGPTAETAIPADSVIIDGTGLYLMPGLMDAHVHLEGGPFWPGMRDEFGDAPLYLAHGVTSVLNLRGTPTFLDWRRRVGNGELLGPTIYTAGEFIIGDGGPSITGRAGQLLVGPNVQSSEDVRRAVAAQAAQRVNVIKYYGGLSSISYNTLIEAARQAGIPLVGHSPDHLGFETWLRGEQSLAHIHQLSNLYFFPLGAVFVHLPILLATALSLLVVIAVGVINGVAIVRESQRQNTRRISSIRIWATITALAAGAAFSLLLIGSYLDSLAQRQIFTGLAVLMAISVCMLIVSSRRHWSSVSPWSRIQISIALVAGATLMYASATFWIPTVWRGTDSNVREIAVRVAEADIPIQSTLAAWSNASARSGRDSDMFQYLPPSIRDRWGSMAVASTDEMSAEFLVFLQKIALALHQAGVPLVAGTDALGAPFMVPGLSLHQELKLLEDSGLTPFEALRTATVNPSSFLMLEQEFGTIAVGKRADLLMQRNNPLEDLAHLMPPIGVMVRGTWLPYEEVDSLLNQLD